VSFLRGVLAALEVSKVFTRSLFVGAEVFEDFELVLKIRSVLAVLRLLGQTAKFHHYIGAAMLAAPIYRFHFPVTLIYWRKRREKSGSVSIFNILVQPC
jgi:hypothetical protein